jgi:uncharacterized protein YlxW (UPF0749 family)
MQKAFKYIFIGLGLIVGVILAWQFSSDKSLSGSFPGDELQAKDELIKDYLDEQSYFQSRIVSLHEQIDTAESGLESQAEVANVEILDELKEDVGLSDVRGPGLEILLNDSPLALRDGADVSDIDLVQAADIRDLVNILSAANAEAISVNNQRIISVSPISSVGTTILINNSHTAPPYTISAVGDTDMMLERIQNDALLSSLFDRVSTNKLVFQVAVKEWVSVPIYNSDLKVNYLNLVD